MKTRSRTGLLFVAAFMVASLATVDGYAAKIVWVSMGESRCEKLLMSAKPASGGYQIERIWAQRPGIVKYTPDVDKGLICFEPQRLGSTKIMVRGKKFELNRYGKKKSGENFYRSFEVRVRSQKDRRGGGTMY